MLTPEASITVLIPTHQRPTLLKRTLESLAACEIPTSYRELVVIENGSRSGVEAVVTNLPERLNARYMHRERANKSYALNEALETVADGLVAFFDDDVRIHPDTLVAYVEMGSKYGPSHFFGGPVSIDFEIRPPEWMMKYLPHSAKGYDLKESRMGDEYLGLNWAAFASDLKRVGRFDPRFGPGSAIGATGQESDMQQRMLDAGITGVDVHKALVWHYVPEHRASKEWLMNRYFRSGIYGGLRRDSVVESLYATLFIPKYVARLFVYKLMNDEAEELNSRLALRAHLGSLKGAMTLQFNRAYSSSQAGDDHEPSSLPNCPPHL